MAFESLSDRLSDIFQNLSGKGKLSEEDVNLALKEVRMALLEADVNFKLVKDFIAKVKESAIGEEVFSSLSPAQTVIKIVRDELTKMMGEENTELKLRPQSEITVLMMVGLQGAGKTTTAAKLAGKFQKQHRKPLLVACDIYRPAAIEQLRVNAEKLSIPFFSLGNQVKPEEIAKKAYEEAKAKGYNLLILDTAGRLQIDDALMEELKRMKSAVPVDWTILTVDAMTGQEAVNVAESFSKEVGVNGVILSKCDGDTRGGAALSIKAMTGQPILYLGMGEKLSDLEPFYPDRMAGRILGMGDVLSLIEKAQSEMDEEKAKESVRKLSKGQFNYDDFLDQMNQLQKLGGIAGILKMLPGMNKAMQGIDLEDSEKKMKQVKSMIQSMTFKERANPKLMNPSRKKRIAQGAGVDIAEVNKLVKQFEESSMKGKHGGFPGMGMGKNPFGRGGGFPL